MTDLLKTGAQWLAEQQAAHAAHNVTYTRSGVSATVAALKAFASYDLADAAGPLADVEQADFVIRVADLRLNGSAITPAAGDRVAESVGSQTVTYEVMPQGADDAPSWEYTDQYCYAFRIHTKRVGSS